MSTTNRIIIRGGSIIELTTGVLRPADILIENDTIASLIDPNAPVEDAIPIDASDRILHAGLVNSHTHGHGALAKGMGDKWTLELLLAAGPWIYGSQSLEDMQVCAALNGLEMALKGCTACYDLYVEFPLPSVEGMAAVAAGYREVGIRAVIAPMVADVPFYAAIPGLADAMPRGLRRDMEAFATQPSQTILRRLEELFANWRHERSEFGIAVAPTIPLHCSDKFLGGCVDLATRYDAGIHSHVSESKVQTVASFDRFGSTIVDHLKGQNALGPRFTAAHGVWLTPNDMTVLADCGAHVAHNPGSNMRLGNGLAHFRGMLDHGVNVGLGTDGSSCSDNQNMYEAMRLASFVSKAQTPHIEHWCSTLEVARAATSGGAHLLGLGDQIGRLAPGYKADIVFLDARHPNWIPMNDPVNQLVHTEDGNAVVDVMVGGKFIVRNRQPVGLSLTLLAEKVARIRDRLETMNAGKKLLSEEFAKVVGRFCPSFTRKRYGVDRYLDTSFPKNTFSPS